MMKRLTLHVCIKRPTQTRFHIWLMSWLLFAAARVGGMGIVGVEIEDEGAIGG